MKKINGFTLIELLAVLIILSILLALSVPAYLTILSDIRRDNYNAKVTEVELQANKYGEKIKDEVKQKGKSCLLIKIPKLIEMGSLTSEDEKENVLYNLSDNTVMDGDIRICYDTIGLDIRSFYTTNFNANKVYHIKDKVYYNNKIYECLHTYPGDGTGINATYYVKQTKKNLPYFTEIKY